MWNWPVGQTPPQTEMQRFFSDSVGDETGKEGNIVDSGEEQKDEKIGGHMRSVLMFSCSHVLCV